MEIKSVIFGSKADGQTVRSYELKNASGMTVRLLDMGATIQSIIVPDKDGKATDVCLGFNNVKDYEDGTCYFGATIGRYANRIGGARFELNGVEYKLVPNEGRNQLHGGSGFDKKLFSVNPVGENTLEFGYVAADGEDGFPGRLDTKVRFTLTDDNALRMDYSAVSDKDTLVNLTNHCYFNLNGEGNGNILDHSMYINSSEITEVDPECIPTGVIADVTGTPFDFRQPKKIGRDIDLDNEQLRNGQGFDHNFVIDGDAGLKIAAEAVSPLTGVKLTVMSTLPGVQFYAGNCITPGVIGKSGSYPKRSGFCLEAQFYPDSPNNSHFPSAVLPAGKEYKHTIIFKFDVCQEQA